MCQILYPVSLCNDCGKEVDLSYLQDLCEIVLAVPGTPFGTCGRTSRRKVCSPQISVCQECRDWSAQEVVESVTSQAAQNMFIMPRPSMEPGSSGLRVDTAPHAGVNESQRIGSAVFASGIQNRRNVQSQQPETLKRPVRQARHPRTPSFTRDYHRGSNWEVFDSQDGDHDDGNDDFNNYYCSSDGYDGGDEYSGGDDDDDDDDNDNGPGSFQSLSTANRTSGISALSSNDPITPHISLLTYPGENSPFDFGYTVPRAIPQPTPEMADFFSNHVYVSAAEQLPPFPDYQVHIDDNWVPVEWRPAREMPSHLMHELDYTTADCVFRRHRVYFVPVAEEQDIVMIVTPCGKRSYLISAQLYKETSERVNKLETEAEAQALRKEFAAAEAARKQEEKKKMQGGVCIFHPCRVAACPSTHGLNQHRPFDTGLFYRAGRNSETTQRAGPLRQKRSWMVMEAGQRTETRPVDDVFGGGKEKQGQSISDATQEHENAYPDMQQEQFENANQEYPNKHRNILVENNTSWTPAAGLNSAANRNNSEPQTPSTIHLSADKSKDIANSKGTAVRAPRRIIERNGNVHTMLVTRDPTLESSGSPPFDRRQMSPFELVKRLG